MKATAPSSLDTRAMTAALRYAQQYGSATVNFYKPVFPDDVVTHADRHTVLSELLCNLADSQGMSMAIIIATGTSESYTAELRRMDNEEGIEPVTMVDAIDATGLVVEELDATLYDVEELPGEATNPEFTLEEVEKRHVA